MNCAVAALKSDLTNASALGSESFASSLVMTQMPETFVGLKVIASNEIADKIDETPCPVHPTDDPAVARPTKTFTGTCRIPVILPMTVSGRSSSMNALANGESGANGEANAGSVV